MIPTGLHLGSGRLWLVPRLVGTTKPSVDLPNGRLGPQKAREVGQQRQKAQNHVARSHSSDMASESDFELAK